MNSSKQTSIAILFIILATLAFACMNAMAKQLTNLHPLQIVFFRSLGTFVFIFPYMLYKRIPLLGSNRKFLILRGIIGFLSLATFFMAVQRMPLGSAVSIRYLGPLVSVVLSMYFLKESVKRLQWLGFVIALVGVFVLKGFDLRITTEGFSLAAFSAITVGIVFTLVRYLATREHHLTIINYFMLISISLSLLSFPYWQPILADQWILLFGIGITGLFGQVLMTLAFKNGDTNTVAPFKYMELIFALIIGFFIFEETYSILASLGILLLVLGMLVNLLAKSRKKIN